jgi:GNAT superfamily N-acetyltransferase
MEVYNNSEITPSHISQAATLFSENYGIWGSRGPKPGKRIKMSPSTLQDQILPQSGEEDKTRQYRLVRMTCDGELVGQAFACYWNCTFEAHSTDEEGEIREANAITSRVCLVTQLVVKKEWRGKGTAKRMLQELRDENVSSYGILSSSAFAICAAWRVFGGTKGKFLALLNGLKESFCDSCW